MIMVMSSFSKICVFKAFSVQTKTDVFKFLLVEELFRKALFSVGNFYRLVWTIGLAAEIKAAFSQVDGT